MNFVCTELLNPDRHSDVLSACIQAQAAIHAGHEQALAAVKAGHKALQAGLCAILAAVVSAMVAAILFHYQRNHEQTMAADQRRHEVKSKIYTKASPALTETLITITRMMDFKIATVDILGPYQEKLIDIFPMHLVGEIGLISDLMDFM